MTRQDVEKMQILKVEEHLMQLTRMYMRMHVGVIRSDEARRAECRQLIQALAKDIAEWADIYPLVVSEASADSSED